MVAYSGETQGCYVSTLDYYHRTWLGVSLIVFGIAGAAINGWLMSTILIGSRLTANTMLILLNLTVACLGRSLLGGFPFAGTSVLAGSWLFGNGCCQMFGFLRQFFGIAQLATLTFLSVERLLISRHRHLEKRLSLELYVMGVVCCWLAAVTWSVPPLTGVGRYACDVTGLACEIDWRRTTDHYHVGFNAGLLLIGYGLPVIIICACSWRALTSGKNQVSVTEDGVFRTHHQHSMNKTTVVLVWGMFLAWLPQAVLASWLFISPPGDTQDVRAHFPVALVVMAPLSSEVSTIIPVVVYLACEPRMRRALLGILGKSPKVRTMKRSRRGTQLAEIK